MRFQLIFLMCLVTKGFSLTCNYCDSGAYSGGQFLKIDAGSQNMVNCTDAITGNYYEADCTTDVKNPNGGAPLINDKFYCVRIDYTNSTGSKEVLRTCSPTSFNGKICTMQSGTEICGFITSCSTNNCNSAAYTGTDPEVSQQQGNGGNSVLTVGHLLSSVIGMCITLSLYH